MPRKTTTKLTLLSLPTALSASTSADGLSINILFSEALTLSSGSNIDGFTISVGGITFSPHTAVISGSNTSEVILTVLNWQQILYYQGVAITYVQGSYLMQNGSNSVANFTMSVVNNVVSTLFDPLLYTQSKCDYSNGDLYQLTSQSYPSASVVLSTTPPYGDVIINEDLGSGGMQIHHFCAYSPTSAIVKNSSSVIPIASSANATVISTNYFATQFLAPNETDFNNFGVFLYATPVATGSNSAFASDNLTFTLYSDNYGVPGVPLAVIGTISYNTIATSLTFYTLTTPTGFSYDLVHGTEYWIVTQVNPAPTNAVIYANVANSGLGISATSSDSVSWTTSINPGILVTPLKTFTQGSGNTETLFPVPSVLLVQDPLNNSILTPLPGTIGGLGSPNSSENLGIINSNSQELNQRSLCILFNAPIKVQCIEFCVEASTQKSYVVECQMLVNGVLTWVQLTNMIADPVLTPNYFYYLFTTSTLPTIYAARIRYRGDYFGNSNTGSTTQLTVSGKGNLTPASYFQVSHFPDFRDAVDCATFMGFSTDSGWIPFSDGTSYFYWNLVNLSREWTVLSGIDGHNSELATIPPLLIPMGSYFLVSSGTRINKVSTSQTITQVFDASPAYVTSYISIGNKTYLGMSNGNILDAISFATITTLPGNTPINAMNFFNGKVYIGTTVTGTLSLYNWNVTSSPPVQDRQFTQKSINGFAIGSDKNLYVALGGGGGIVYQFNGTTWTPFNDTGFDSIESIIMSSATNQLWCSVNGGTLFTYTFTPSPGAWNRVSNGNGSTIYKLVDDPNKGYVWAVGNQDIMVYSASTSNFVSVVEPVSSSPSPPTNPISTSVAYLGPQAYSASNDGYVYMLADTNLANVVRYAYLKLKDAVGNVTTVPISDSIIQSVPKTSTGQTTAQGMLYQVDPTQMGTTNSSLVTFLTPTPSNPVSGGTRTLLETGTYFSETFFAATMSQWVSIGFTYQLPTTPTSSIPAGLNSGVQIDLYVRTANDYNTLITTGWGTPFTITSMPTGGSNITDTATFPITTLQGQWIQYQLVLTSSTFGVTPVVQNISLSYTAASSSYFFTKVFDTAQYTYSGNGIPEIRRFMFVSDEYTGQGQIHYAYSTNPDGNLSFSSTDYVIITPNTIVELPNPSEFIQFGIQLVSASTPAIVDDFGVILETASQTIQFMKHVATTESFTIASGSTTVTVSDSTGFVTGEMVLINDGTNFMHYNITAIPTTSSITITANRQSGDSSLSGTMDIGATIVIT